MSMQRMYMEGLERGEKHAYIKAWMKTLPERQEDYIPVYIENRHNMDIRPIMNKVRKQFCKYGKKCVFKLCPCQCKRCFPELRSVSSVDVPPLPSLGSSFSVTLEKPTLNRYFSDTGSTPQVESTSVSGSPGVDKVNNDVDDDPGVFETLKTTIVGMCKCLFRCGNTGSY